MRKLLAALTARGALLHALVDALVAFASAVGAVLDMFAAAPKQPAASHPPLRALAPRPESKSDPIPAVPAMQTAAAQFARPSITPPISNGDP